VDLARLLLKGGLLAAGNSAASYRARAEPAMKPRTAGAGQPYR
jgi:hypothetical protein